jgi:hypothetical protein
LAAPWNVDPAHSEVSFKVDHFFTPVRGTFRGFDVALDYDPAAPVRTSVRATIEIASVDTGNDQRDGHLQVDSAIEYLSFLRLYESSPDWDLSLPSPIEGHSRRKESRP